MKCDAVRFSAYVKGLGYTRVNIMPLVLAPAI